MGLEGAHSREPRLRQRGRGFAILLAANNVLGTGPGPLHCWKQAVPLAGLEAAKAAVLSTRGAIHLLVDNASVVKGIRRGFGFKHTSNFHK